MKQYLTATVQALSQTELDNLIEPLALAHVKQTDPDPEIRVYSIGHEGKANLHLPGVGKKTFTWIQAAVQWIADKLRLGTAVFDRHDPSTNSHEGRVQIGEVIGKATKQIGDRFSTLAAIHIFPQFKTRPLDVASIEAEIEYDHDEYQAWPTSVNSVSGIALSNSDIDNPGFPGATLLGAVQAYVQAFAGELGEKPMNLSDVEAAVKELGLKPTQVFDVTDIMGDSAVDAKVKEAHSDYIKGGERLTQERDKLRDTVARLENEKAESDTKLTQLQLLSKSSTAIDAILADPERKLDDKAKTFIKRNLKNFTTSATDESTLTAELGEFVNGMAKEYGELAKDVFGVDVNKTQDTNQFKLPPSVILGDQKTPEGTSPPAIPPTRQTVLEAEMNPDLNPLIPGGKAAVEAQKT